MIEPKIITDLPREVNYNQVSEFLLMVAKNNPKYSARAYKLLTEPLYNNENMAFSISEGAWDNWLSEYYHLVREVNGGIRYESYEEVNRVCQLLQKDIQKIKEWLDDWYQLNREYYGLTGRDQLIILGKAILELSKELCPVETGKLRDSAKLVINDNSVTIAYDCPYASYVHENLMARHKRGQAKFLEKAVQRYLPNDASWVHVHSESVWVKIGFDFTVNYGHYG